MKHTTKKQYQIFKKTFLKYQTRFGLLEWNIFFEWRNCDGFASIEPHHDGMGAIVCMAKDIKDADWQDFDPKDCAKHEAIHLLSADLWYAGRCRYIMPDDISQTWERLTVKLEKLIS